VSARILGARDFRAFDTRINGARLIHANLGHWTTVRSSLKSIERFRSQILVSGPQGRPCTAVTYKGRQNPHAFENDPSGRPEARAQRLSSSTLSAQILM